MNHLSISGAIVFFTSLACAFFVLLKPPRNALKLTWVLFTLAVSAWGLGLYKGFSTDVYSSALFWSRFLNIAAILIPIFFFHFVISFLQKNKSIELAVYYGISGLFFASAIAFPRLFIPTVSQKLTFHYYPDAGPLYYFFPFLFAYLLIYAIILLIRAYPDVSDLKKNQIRYITLGYLIGFSGGSTTFPLVFNIGLYPFGTYIFPAHILLSTYAIIKYRLMDLKIVVTRAGSLLVVYSLVLGVPFWFGFVTGRWIVATIIMAFLATAGPFLYLAIKSKAEGIILAEQRHYQKILMQASEGMVREHDLHRLLNLIVHIISRSVRIAFTAIFIEDKETGSYVLRAIRGSEKDPLRAVFPFEDPMIEFLKKKKEPFTWEELPPEIQKQLDTRLDVSLIVPSFMGKRLIGFLFLGKKKNNTLYSRDDINVFITLANQAALAVENCIFMEKFKAAQERLFNAEKLALIGGMADGLAHQIKNRLNQFSMASGEMGMEIDEINGGFDAILENPARLKEKIAYLKKCTESITDNVKKTNSVIQGVLQFAKTENKGSYFSNFHLGELAAQCEQLLKVKHGVADLGITADLGEDDLVYGVQVQIMECLLNTLDNAYEAIEEKANYRLKEEERKSFKPEIRLSLAQNEKTSIIAVSDNGVGVKDENKFKVFGAFFTTKPSSKSGSGIGAYVVRRMIQENHHGKIWFESEYGKGTTFYIEIPRNVTVQ